MAHGEMGFIPKSIAQMPVPVAMSSTLCTPSPRGARWSSPCNVNTNNWCCMSMLVNFCHFANSKNHTPNLFCSVLKLKS
jgi:hypothetical protein